ncbi:MAG TPA: VOC family protein [Pyrinomonadaceae bacterium]|nr:VOC family protein [Pyrinomonadaceae bacterium]
MILGIHHAQITIPKGAENEAREFYCALLGLVEVPKPDELAGRGGFWLSVGDRQVHVGTEATAGREQTKAHVAYLVDDIEKWRGILAAAEVAIIEGIPIPGYSRFEFRDPFGNRVEFLQTVDQKTNSSS